MVFWVLFLNLLPMTLDGHITEFRPGFFSWFLKTVLLRFSKYA